MASKDIAPILARDFVDLKLDQDRMIGALDILKKYQEKQQGIPWFVFLDPEGHPLITSTNPEGKNVGFPWEDFEIAHFMNMIDKVRKRITPQEIEHLRASLTANRAKK